MALLEEASLSYGITTACQALAVPRSWYYRQKAAGSGSGEARVAADAQARAKRGGESQDADGTQQ